MATKPSSPPEWTRVAKILSDLNEPKLAKDFLQQVLDAGLDEGQLAGLERMLGAATFVELASRDDLAPQGQLLGHAVLGSGRPRGPR